MSRIPLTRRIDVLGAINLATLALYTVMSPLLAAVAVKQPRRTEILAAWAAKITSFTPLAGYGWVERNPFGTKDALFLGCAVPLVVLTANFLGLLIFLAHRRADLEPQFVRRLHAWGIAFAVVAVPAIPIYAQDFWLSVGWGRMIADGVNPYYSDFTPASLEGIPLALAQRRMTYGPMWALVCGVLGFLLPHEALIEGAAYKILLLTAWLGGFWLVRALMSKRTVWEQCVSMAVFGWMPLAITQGMAEGHNDVVLIALMIGWLYAAQQDGKWQATLLLTGSALVKYVSVPLLALDFLRRGDLRDLAARGTAAFLVSAMVFGAFYRSPEFFSSAWEMRSWPHFLEPASIGQAFAGVASAGVVSGTSRLIRFSILFFALVGVVQYLMVREFGRLCRAALAVMAAVLFAFVGHVWPWYLLWVIAPAAVAPSSRWAHWVVGVAVPFPFVYVVWSVFPKSGADVRYVYPTVAIYAFSVVWAWVIAPRLLPTAQNDCC